MFDLRTLIEEDLGQPKMQGKRPYWYCPFHADKNTPSLTLTPNRDRFKCFGCGKSGGAMVWLMEVREKPKAEAYEEARQLGLADGWNTDGASRQKARRGRKGTRPQWEPTKPAPAVATEAPGPTWSPKAALAVVETCEAALWSDAGAKAREALAARGIRENTAKAWRLGYNPIARKVGGLFVPRGGVIPCLVGGAVQYVKVRRGPSDYIQVKGSKPAIYGLDHLTGKRVVVICEGELDAVLLWQEAGDLVDVVALGSKNTRPALPFLSHLAGAARWLVALDQDADEDAEWWADFSGRVRRVRPLQGNDLTDFHRAGGDLRAWVTYHLERLEVQDAPEGPESAETAGKLPKVTESYHKDAQGTPLPAVATVSPEIAARAEALLSRMAEGDVVAARFYADLAEAMGWPVYGRGVAGWGEWAEEVQDGTG